MNDGSDKVFKLKKTILSTNQNPLIESIAYLNNLEEFISKEITLLKIIYPI